MDSSMDALRRAFRDITAGHTSATVLGRPGYIRHLSYADQIALDETRQQFYDDARADGIKTDAERLAEVTASGEWPAAKEQELTRARQHVEALRDGLSKTRAKMPSAVKSYLGKIDEAQKAYEQLAWERRKLLGLTCEVSADQEVNDLYIVSNLFRDPGLTEPLWPEREFGYLPDNVVSQIVGDYTRAMEGCSETGLKRLAMSPLFQSFFQLAGDNYTTVFGKPLVQLTFFQRDLLRYGAHFRHIFTTHDISKWKKEVLEDPDLLTEYAASVTAKKAELDAQGANEPGAIVIGAKQEDAKALGVRSANPVNQIMGKHGGNVLDWVAKQGA